MLLRMAVVLFIVYRQSSAANQSTTSEHSSDSTNHHDGGSKTAIINLNLDGLATAGAKLVVHDWGNGHNWTLKRIIPTHQQPEHQHRPVHMKQAAKETVLDMAEVPFESQLDQNIPDRQFSPQDIAALSSLHHQSDITFAHLPLVDDIDVEGSPETDCGIVDTITDSTDADPPCLPESTEIPPSANPSSAWRPNPFFGMAFNPNDQTFPGWRPSRDSMLNIEPPQRNSGRSAAIAGVQNPWSQTEAASLATKDSMENRKIIDNERKQPGLLGSSTLLTSILGGALGVVLLIGALLFIVPRVRRSCGKSGSLVLPVSMRSTARAQRN